MSLCKDLVFLILQFCDEENLKRTAHILEQETAYFFNLHYFEDSLLNGKWDEAEEYLSSFTALDDNIHSTKMYFEIRKQKYLEALHKNDFSAALDILRKQLKVFDKELYTEMTQLLSLDDFSFFGDMSSARKAIVTDLRTVVEANPLLRDRAKFPHVSKSRLRRLINQSLNWQHIHCANPNSNPIIDTLLTDHKCFEPDNIFDQLSKDFPSSTLLNGVDQSRQGLQPDDEEADSRNELPTEFPRSVERIINTGSSPTTMDFNPIDETLLLVGKGIGDIDLWDVVSSEKLFKREFVVPGVLRDNMEKSLGVAVNRVKWSSDGALFGVAYSKRVIHLFSYHADIKQFEILLEIDAHNGSVNDIAFSSPHEKLVVISCGDDKLIRVWDGLTGEKQYTFDGHDAPVYSLCPHTKKDVPFLFSVSTSGEIKAWLFDEDSESKLTYNAPGFCCMRMVYSTDGKRLFSCGTNKNGESYIVEWNERDGFIVRYYHGLSKCSSTMVHFDTSCNRFLAAGDDSLIKIWDMDSAEILAVIDADGDLPARPYICFSRKGNMLAVCADDNQIKILVNDKGHELLQNSESGLLTESFKQLSVNSTPLKAHASSILTKVNISKVVEVTRCKSLLLHSEVEVNLIRRLLYARSGNAVMALAEDGTHLLWRWTKSKANSSGIATTKCSPQLHRPSNGSLMVNDTPAENDAVITPSFTWSKNDAYVISESGGMVNLYNAQTFKNLRTVLPPPPAATCIMFYPLDNNVIAVGMDNSNILILNIREDNTISTLRGHSSRVTSLAFSNTLNVLVSCAVDTEIVIWDTVTWEKKRSTTMQISVSFLASEKSETHVEFVKDHSQFLAVHETQLAIYETTTLRSLRQWTLANFCTRISDAKCSCDGEWVYAVMRDGIVLILGASDLLPRFEIGLSAYVLSSDSWNVGPVVVAVHPQKACQVALGMSNGEVYVIEPLGYDESKWEAVEPPLLSFGS